MLQKLKSIRVSALLASLVLLGCEGKTLPSKGELMLAISTDMQVPRDFDTIHLTVSTYGTVRFSDDFQVGPGHLKLPATFGVVAGNDPSQPVTIQVSSTQKGTVRTFREIVTTVPADRIATLYIPIEWLCLDQVQVSSSGKVSSSCDADETCVAGSCKTIRVDSSTLNTYTVPAVFGGGDGKGSGNCFDTVQCFAEGHDVAVDMSDCTIANVKATQVGTGVSVAMVLEPGAEGICGPEACLVPIDADTTTGWTLDNDRIQLPSAVCDRLTSGQAAAVAVTTSCAAKTPSLPTCGAWSSVNTIVATLDAGAPMSLGTGGTAGNGGTSSSGNTTATSGGATGVGGTSTSGGTTGVGGTSTSGGTTGAGGTTSVGGTMGTGGTVSSAGTVAVGGTTSTGSTLGTGGFVTTGGIATTAGGTASTAGLTSVSTGGTTFVSSAQGGQGGSSGSSSGGQGTTGGGVGTGGQTATGNSSWAPSTACVQKASTLADSLTLAQQIGQMTLVDSGGLTTSEVSSAYLGAVLSGAGTDPTAGNSISSWSTQISSFLNVAKSLSPHAGLLYGIDAPHGNSNVVDAVIFPHNIGLGATRNAQLVQDIARITALEMLGVGANWALDPTVTAALDERWGRTYETFSEIPDLAGELGLATVKGLQNGMLGSSQSVLACAKQYAGDGSTDNGKNGGDVTLLDEATFRKVAIETYRPSIEGGVGSIMVSYGSYQGTKMTGSQKWLTDVLKGEYGFQGFVVSGWDAITQLSGTFSDQVKAAINAGIDMVMLSHGTSSHTAAELSSTLSTLVNSGNVAPERVKDAARRVLTIKCEMGLLDRDTVIDPSLTAAIDESNAFMAAWLPGTEGDGIADVLFGDYKPTGKLSFSWPAVLSQIPINERDGKTPLFAYGYGLTYP